MTAWEDLKVGDRIVATYTGVIEVIPRDGDGLYARDEAGRLRWIQPRGMTFEKIPDPAPTTPGTIILAEGVAYVLALDGMWHRVGVLGVQANKSTPEQIARVGWSLLHEPPKREPLYSEEF